MANVHSIWQTVVTGKLIVVFENEGAEMVDSYRAILDAVMEADVCIQVKKGKDPGVFVNDRSNPPYTLVNYDRKNKVVIVRRK